MISIKKLNIYPKMIDIVESTLAILSKLYNPIPKKGDTVTIKKAEQNSSILILVFI